MSQFLRRSGVSSSIFKNPQQGSVEPHLTPELYEGRRKIAIGSSIVHILQLLILEPNRRVLGYTLYKRENIILEENVLEIGGGEWDGMTNELVFGDNQYSYNGSLNFGAHYR